MNETTAWWMLIYKIPPDPSSARVAAWRHLKAQGAVALQQSVWVLPPEAGHEAFFMTMRQTIELGGGQAYVFRVEALDDAAVRERFIADRDAEYTELLDRCQAFADEMAREHAAAKHTFAELAELEDEGAKLQQWFAKIQARDFYPTARQADARAALAQADTALQAFAHAVYVAEGLQQAADSPPSSETDAAPQGGTE